MDLQAKLTEAKALVKEMTDTMEESKIAHAESIKNQKYAIAVANATVRAYQKLIEKAESLEK